MWFAVGSRYRLKPTFGNFALLSFQLPRKVSFNLTVSSTCSKEIFVPALEPMKSLFFGIMVPLAATGAHNQESAVCMHVLTVMSQRVCGKSHTKAGIWRKIHLWLPLTNLEVAGSKKALYKAGNRDLGYRSKKVAHRLLLNYTANCSVRRFLTQPTNLK